MSFARSGAVEQPKPRIQRNTPRILARRGWSINTAAKRLGCDVGHLSRVLSGERSSKSLMTRVNELPNLIS
ncbi:MAG: transcriptional regulator [Luteolibacter sp.]|uniref:transcriptional regulator n=1 Tax=Luteolibacter sp. TaxID=1962973 RepID=UPI00326589E7